MVLSCQGAKDPLELHPVLALGEDAMVSFCRREAIPNQ
jgi:hypothetical protein